MNTRTVPVEPTEEMLNAARDWSYNLLGKPIGNAAAIGCYHAMLAAAPPQPEPTDHLAVPDAHLREQIADAQARQAKGEGEPGDAELAHYKEPERRVAQRRRLPNYSYPMQRKAISDRRQNAAVESPDPAAPASTLPLTHETINMLDMACNEETFNALRKQALRAIDQERQLAEKDREIASAIVERNLWIDEARRHNKNADYWRERAEKAEQLARGLNLNLTTAVENTSHWMQRAEKAEAELAELRRAK